MPDIISYLMGIITGVVPVLLVEEYRLLRERKIRHRERKEQAVSMLRVELKRFCSAWNNFKNIREMQYGPELTNFQYNLEYISRAIENVASASEGLLPADIINEALEISRNLLVLSKKEFYLDGGKSYKEFLELGDRLLKSCESLLNVLS